MLLSSRTPDFPDTPDPSDPAAAVTADPATARDGTPAPGRLRARRLRSLRTILALMLREMSTTYGRTPGGYLWAIVEPVAAIALLTVVFSLALRSPSLGTSFGLFYATGFLPFTLFMQVSNKTASALRFSRPLLRYPGVRFIDAILARFLLTTLTHVAVAYLLLSVIMIMFDVRTILDLEPIVQAFGLAALLGLGIGSLNCYLVMRFPVWDSLWSVLTAPLFLLSGIFYVPEDLPAGFLDIVTVNPIVHIIGLMRTGFYPTYDAAYVSVSYVLVIALAALALGLLLLNRFHRDLLNL